MIKEDNEDFKNFTKCCMCDNDYVNNDVKVRDYCDIQALRIETVISLSN